VKLGSREVQMGKVLALAALGVAGMCSVAACGAAVQAGSQPRPPPSAAAPGSTGMARDIARIAMGTGGLAALDNGELRAQLTAALCAAGWSEEAARNANIHVLAVAGAR